MDENFFAIKDFLNSFLDGLHIENGNEICDFFSNWQDIVGEKLGAHTKVEDIKDGVLYILVDHPGWMQTIQMNKNKILSDVKKRYKNLGIMSISLKVKTTSH